MDDEQNDQTHFRRYNEDVRRNRGRKCILICWRSAGFTIDGGRPVRKYAGRLSTDSKKRMLSFNFNKKKETGVKQVHTGDKMLYEGIV